MLDRTVPPSFQTIDQLKIRQVEKVDLENSIPFYYLRSGNQEVIRLELILEGGLWSENKYGQSSLTSKMLSEGTSSYSAGELAEKFDNVGGYFEINSGPDFINFNFYFLSKHLDYLLPVIAEILDKPIFPQREFDTIKNIIQQTLKVNLEKSSYVATRKFKEHIYGSNHPYGHFLNSDEIDQIEKDDVSNYYFDSVRSNYVLALLSGQFSDHDLNKIAKFLGNAAPIASKNEKRYPIEDPERNKLYIEKEGAVQSSIRIGKRSILPNHADYFKLLISNEILGGYFGSRLMKNIREEKGLTYGIYSQIINHKNQSHFVIGADVKKSLVNEAISEVLKEIKHLYTEGVPMQELETVKNFMLGQLQSSISTPFSLADKFKTIFIRGFDYSYYDTLVEEIKGITSEDVMNTTKKYLSEDSLNTVIVG